MRLFCNLYEPIVLLVKYGFSDQTARYGLSICDSQTQKKQVFSGRGSKIVKSILLTPSPNPGLFEKVES